MNKLEQLKQGAREKILRCKQLAEDRGVLLSSPSQYRCERERCRKTWVVGDTAPVCEMFDIEGYSDWVADNVVSAVEAEVVPEEIAGHNCNDECLSEDGDEECELERMQDSAYNQCRAKVVEAFRTFKGDMDTNGDGFVSPNEGEIYRLNKTDV